MSESKDSQSKVSEWLEGKVRQWLMEEGWKLREVEAPDLSWGFVAENSAGVNLNVAQQQGKYDQCLVRIGCNLVEAQVLLDKLKKEEVEELLWDLRFEFARQEVDFDGLKPPFGKVSIQRSMFADGLTKNTFAETVGKVLRAAMLLRWTLERRLGSVSGSGWIN